MNWVLPHFDASTSVSIIMHGKSDRTLVTVSETHPNFTRIIPKWGAATDYGSMHVSALVIVKS